MGHPVFDVSDAVGKGGEDGGSDGFGGDVELRVIGITVEEETMAADDVTEGEHIDEEEYWTKYGALGDSVRDRGGV